MLTLLDALSLAGDRAGQNDDAFGLTSGPFGDRAFVLDGATDLHDAPFMPAASDASWFARFAAARLHAGAPERDARTLVRRTMAEARAAFEAGLGGRPWPERWALPVSTVLIASETAQGLEILDLGDSRAFGVDAEGVAFEAGAGPKPKDEETLSAARLAQSADGGNARYKTPEGLAYLRKERAAFNRGYFPLCLEPSVADQAQARMFALARPAHLLLATDGFAALSDVYGAYDGPGLVRAALTRGLAALGQELRAIETEDAGATRHPRWKRSDDATALLLRLS